MRVVAGIARGRKLVAPKGDVTRPTSDFVREAMFNTLGSFLDIEGASVLDLFAGTGALGIEALSRGADHATFVESQRAALEAIRANLAATRFVGQATVLSLDAARFSPPAVDLAFVDPPYAFGEWSALLARLNAGIAVLESDREVDPGPGWRVLRVKKYGTTVVTLTSKTESAP